MKLYISILPEILQIYFDCRTRFAKTDLQYNIASVIENPKNIVVVSAKYIQFLDEVFPPESELYDDYTNFITQIIDSTSEIVESSISDSIDEELVSIEEKSPSTIVSIHKKSRTVNGICNAICMEEVQTCLKSRMLLGILKDRTFVIRYSEFSDNQSLKNYFDSLFSLPKHNSSVIIFDRYANINHPYFDFFNEKGIAVKFFKLNANLLDGISLKRKFNSIELYSTSNRELLHERTIILGDSILSIDEDPMNLDVSRKTWTITFEYSGTDATELKKKCSSFTKMSFV